MSHFKARNSNYPSFDRLPSEIPNSYKMVHMNSFNFQENSKLNVKPASKLDSISSATVARQRWLFFTCTSPFLSHSRTTSHNELPRRLLSGGTNDLFSVK